MPRTTRRKGDRDALRHEAEASLRQMAEIQALNLKAFIETADRAFSADAQADGTAEEIERLRYVMALTAVAKFFDTLDGTKFIADRFAELASALQDLNAGIRRPLFGTFKKSGNPDAASNVWRARANVAIAVEARRHQTGMTRIPAAKSIAKECPRINSLVGRKTDKPLWQSILAWRDQFAESRVKNFEGATVFREGMKLLEKCEKIDRNFAELVALALREVRRYTDTLASS